MIIKYEFANGEKTEVEVDEKIGTLIVDSRKKEHTGNEKERYHCVSLDAMPFEGMIFAAELIPDSLVAEREYRENLHKRLKIAMDTLTPIQRRRFLKYASGMSLREIAKQEGVSDHKKIIKSIEGARKKLLKFFSK